MAQNQILIRYDGMQSAAQYYTNCAGDLRELCNAIKTRNVNLIENDWNGEAAISFEQRFREDHAVSMEKVAVALDEIASFITNYIANQESSDKTQAGSLRG